MNECALSEQSHFLRRRQFKTVSNIQANQRLCAVMSLDLSRLHIQHLAITDALRRRYVQGRANRRVYTHTVSIGGFAIGIIMLSTCRPVLDTKCARKSLSYIRVYPWLLGNIAWLSLCLAHFVPLHSYRGGNVEGNRACCS